MLLKQPGGHLLGTVKTKMSSLQGMGMVCGIKRMPLALAGRLSLLRFFACLQ